jgi:ATP-dependent exoDNAse (exonuclease V) beta subunit
MMDEFQDTSRMQWNNFRPLIEESLAHRRSNLIVGDVKQSIYRFRNSDWELLDSQVQKDFRREQVKEETLQVNWRSFKRIVEFNNALFAKAPALLQTLFDDALARSSLPEEKKQRFYSRIVAAYRHSEQRVAPVFQDKEGHVAVEFLPEEHGADWKNTALERLPSVLKGLQDNGFAPKDIAILVRTHQEGAAVADALLAYRGLSAERGRYDFLSDDAFYVSRSPAVRFVIVMLKHLNNPDDPTNRKKAFFAYRALTGGLAEGGEANDFPEDIQGALHVLSHRSLYAMTEGLFRLFPACFPDSEQAFLMALCDRVAEFSQKGGSDLSRFLKWWEETGVNQTIATPDGQDAVRILTIHKSKGLEFRAVILPFCDWGLDHKSANPVFIWCRPDTKPFNRLHLTPVRYGPALAKTRFASDYFEERLRAYIDSLNLLYVAFTRAREELHVFAPQPKDGVPSFNSIAELLGACM